MPRITLVTCTVAMMVVSFVYSIPLSSLKTHCSVSQQLVHIGRAVIQTVITVQCAAMSIEYAAAFNACPLLRMKPLADFRIFLPTSLPLLSVETLALAFRAAVLLIDFRRDDFKLILTIFAIAFHYYLLNTVPKARHRIFWPVYAPTL